MIIQNCPTSHIAFSDEAYINDKKEIRFRSIALVTSSYEDYKNLAYELENIITKYTLHEHKWSKLNNNIGKEFINFLFNNLDKIRIDVLIYDMKDSRHNIIGIDKIKNLQILYYHLLNNVLKNRWINEASWNWYPDENNSIKWKELNNYLRKSSWSNNLNFLNISIPISFYKYYNIKHIVPSQSHLHSFIQLADFFAGIAAYSYNSFEKIKIIYEENAKQMDIFDYLNTSQISNNDKKRIQLVLDIYNNSKKMKLQISLFSSKGFKSHDCESNLNFWLYEPQGDYDKAPTKNH